MARLSLTLLGGFEARLDSGAPVSLPTRKAQGLVAFLAMPQGLAHSRDKLASLLWGSTAEARARTSLRQTLYAVRKSVWGVDPSPLRMEADTVALDSHTVSVDVAGFLQGTAVTTASALADALALYQGDFLEGLAIPEPPFEGWLLGEQSGSGSRPWRASGGCWLTSRPRGRPRPPSRPRCGCWRWSRCRSPLTGR